VIETFQLRYLVPASRVVAGLTGRFEAALVRILVTRCAFRKRKTHVFNVRFCIRNGRMALCALCLLVRAGQRIFCFCVIEERCGLPLLRCMAARTIFAELAAVFVRVAAHALARKSQIGPVQIFDDDSRPRGNRNVLCFVTLLACNARVLSRESEARFAVI